MSRAVAAVVAVVMVASLAAGPVIGVAGSWAADSQRTSGEASLQTPDQFDSTTFRITVYGNGSAIWTIEHRRPLANESQVDQFNTFASTFESEETELYRDFVSDAGVLTDLGTDATGREMTARNFQRSATVDPAQSQGTVRMSFLWTNFAPVDDGRVVVSDVFEGGFYIGDGQSMVVERSDSLRFTDVRPDPDTQSDPESLANSSSVSWIGDRSFNDSRPYVVFQPPSAVEGPAGEGGSTSGSSMFIVALAVIALGAVAVAAWRSGAAAAVLDSGDEGGGTTTEPTPAPGQPPESEEFLDDSDRVLRLIEDNGGRMKQVDIVENTEWSKSKVSMLLSDMEDEGEISKLRVGRENIISIAGQEPDAAGSPFDEE